MGPVDFANSVAGLAIESSKEGNKLRPGDRAVHDWYRFILSYPPHLVRTYVERFGLSSGERMLDPFCGTGTTLVECKKLGIPSVGIEANPMAAFATRVKVNWKVDTPGLFRHAKAVARETICKLESQGIDDSGGLPLFSKHSNNSVILKTLPQEMSKLLLRDSISALPLHKALVLMETLEENRDIRYYAHERLALAKALVSGISNLEFGPEVGVGPPKRDAVVVASWLDAVGKMSDDIYALKAARNVPASVHSGDSRCQSSLVEPCSIDAVITSPPYPNEKEYTRTTRLESVLLGFIKSKQDLRMLKKNLVRSNTRGVYKEDRDDLLVAHHTEIQRIADDIEKRRVELCKTSGFERLYARVTKLYFGGMARHLSDLRGALRPGAQLAYVVGDQASYLRVMIRTGQLLSKIAVSLGYELVGIDLFRTRLATATREHLREEVVVLRWPG